MPDLRGTVRRHSVALLGGEVSVLEVGEPGAEPTVVLLHGIPASAELWRGVLELLAQAGRHAIAPDLPGYGETRLPTTVDHGIPGMVDVAFALVDHLGGRPVELVGHDLGAAAAQLAVVRDTAPWATLTLSHAPTERLWPPPIMRPVFATTRRLGPRAGWALLLGNPRAVARLVLGTHFGDRSVLSPATVARVFRDGKVTDPDGRERFRRHLDAVAHANNSLTVGTSTRVAELGVPLRLIWGDADPALPFDRVAVWWTRRRPDVPVTRLEGAGHFSPLEQPSGFVAGLLGPASAGPR